MTANYMALTPLGLLERSAQVFPDRIAIIHGSLRRNFRDFARRSKQLASVLVQKEGLQRGEVVGVMLSNTPQMLEAHYGVPMSGAVLCPFNYRLDVRTIAFSVEHSECKILIVDREYSKNVMEALALIPEAKRPKLIDVDDTFCSPDTPKGPAIGVMEYEEYIAGGDPDFVWTPPTDEWDSLSLCYTSGTTSDPKGVLLSHRGAYLMCMNNSVKWAMPRHARYLWTLPMFHCNGWYFTYTITAIAGTHICLRKVIAEDIFYAIKEHKADHMCGAPIVMSTMLQYTGGKTWSHRVKFMVAAAAPPAAVLAKMDEFDIDVTHAYGLTESFGPAVLCDPKDEWEGLPLEERAALKARQGVRGHALEYLDVWDPETAKPVPRDGKTIGEVVFRGNTIMKGYLKNPSATEKEFRNGVFNSGDLGVIHPDGYIQLKDRSKDIIISGGENISTLEVESLLRKHPKVTEVAVVARPDEKWGETPVAWVVLAPGAKLDDQEIYQWCRSNMPRYMVPRTYMFETLDKVKTSTGKVQKHVLRKLAKELTKPPMEILSADQSRARSKL